MDRGSILHFPNFTFSNGRSKPKFFIVIYEEGEDLILFSLPTSQQYISNELRIEGCNNHTLSNGGYISMYYFPSGKTIGQNGFSFSKDTFCSFSKGLLKGNQHKINALPFTLEDKMMNSEFLDFLLCIKESDNLQNAYIELIDRLIDDIENL